MTLLVTCVPDDIFYMLRDLSFRNDRPNEVFHIVRKFMLYYVCVGVEGFDNSVFVEKSDEESNNDIDYCNSDYGLNCLFCIKRKREIHI